MLRLADYPLTVSATLIGLVVGSFVGVSTDNLIAAFAAFCLFATIGWTWRKGDPPVLPFILAYQWISVTAGYWYLQGFDSFPGIYRPGDVEYTMFLALAGLLVLAAGIRIAAQATTRATTYHTAPPAPAPALIKVLFCVVMATYGLDYVYTVNARDFGGLSSFVQRILEFRQILLVTLWLAIIRSRRYVPLLLISFAWTVVPRLGSYYSDFKSPVVLMLIVLAAAWRPWEQGTVKRSFVAGLKAAPFVAALVIVLLVWQGSLKKNTRLAHDDGSLGRDAIDRIGFFVQNFRAELPQLFETPEPYVEALVERVSYITFFSRVLEHVPNREPHADGELLKMAMSNAFIPRVLVPEKPELPSDSYYTRRFTGIPVAEAGTSVSIGYMAEFYSDWGLRGMYASILLFGVWIGLVGSLVRRLTAVPALKFAAITTVLLGVADFEQQFIKGFAALNLNAIVTIVLVFALKPWLQRISGSQPVSGKSPAPAAVAEAPVR